jgi:hypothetical protein
MSCPSALTNATLCSQKHSKNASAFGPVTRIEPRLQCCNESEVFAFEGCSSSRSPGGTVLPSSRRHLSRTAQSARSDLRSTRQTSARTARAVIAATVVIAGPKVLDFYGGFCADRATCLKADGERHHGPVLSGDSNAQKK